MLPPLSYLKFSDLIYPVVEKILEASRRICVLFHLNQHYAEKSYEILGKVS